MPADRNIVLIGMPGVGKSTLGVLLAKAQGMDFIDTDVRLQSREGRSLQDILDGDGRQAFRSIEESIVADLSCRHTVVATGGSVVYSARAMEHLQSLGPIVHLYLPLQHLLQRLGDVGSRGVVRLPGQTLNDLFAEREPLYRHYADATVDCRGTNHEQAVDLIIKAVGRTAT